MQLKIAENVRRLRLARGLTQEQFAERIGIAGQTVSKWECGDGYPDITTLPLIANCFNVSVDEILGMADIRDDARVNEAGMRRIEIMKSVSANPDLTPEQRTELITAQIAEINRELALEFPYNYEVQLNYAASLRDIGEPQNALPIIERIMENCTISWIRNSAAISLAEVYKLLGEHEKCAEQVATLPTVFNSREFAEAYLMQNDEPTIENVVKLRISAQQVIGFGNSFATTVTLMQKRLGVECAQEELQIQHIHDALWQLQRLWRVNDLGGAYDFGSSLESLDAYMEAMSAARERGGVGV